MKIIKNVFYWVGATIMLIVDMVVMIPYSIYMIVNCWYHKYQYPKWRLNKHRPYKKYIKTMSKLYYNGNEEEA